MFVSTSLDGKKEQVKKENFETFAIFWCQTLFSMYWHLPRKWKKKNRDKNITWDCQERWGNWAKVFKLINYILYSKWKYIVICYSICPQLQVSKWIKRWFDIKGLVFMHKMVNLCIFSNWPNYKLEKSSLKRKKKSFLCILKK